MQKARPRTGLSRCESSLHFSHKLQLRESGRQAPVTLCLARNSVFLTDEIEILGQNLLLKDRKAAPDVRY